MERIEATVQVVKCNQLHAFVVLPKRWVVQQSFAWLEEFRRLWKKCEPKLDTSLQLGQRAFLVLILIKTSMLKSTLETSLATLEEVTGSIPIKSPISTSIFRVLPRPP